MALKSHLSHYAAANTDEFPNGLRGGQWAPKPLALPTATRPAALSAPPKFSPDAGTPPAREVLVLSRDQFLLEIEREKRRADRSKSPVSTVHWHTQSDDGGDHGAQGLLEVLRTSCRETDTIGELGGGIVSVLLPDTGKDGVSAFIRKVSDRMRDARTPTTAVTYPDDAFDGIANGEGVPDETSPLAEASSMSSRWGDATKRVIDIVFSLLLLFSLAPIMIATALAVALTSRGPIIFRQSRLGRGGVPFDFYKFRSMRPSNDDSIHREFVSSLIQGKHADINQQSSGDPLFKIKNDPRVTPIGRFIRNTSIDELPQLFNVLKGDMSLVGPRPPLSYEAEQYQSWHLRRILEVRPGITGLWQVEGRSRVSFDEMVRMDLRYIKQRSLALDLKLLVRTVGVVLTRHGAK